MPVCHLLDVPVMADVGDPLRLPRLKFQLDLTLYVVGIVMASGVPADEPREGTSTLITKPRDHTSSAVTEHATVGGGLGGGGGGLGGGRGLGEIGRAHV